MEHSGKGLATFQLHRDPNLIRGSMAIAYWITEKFARHHAGLIGNLPFEV
jgi:hypothetical protein